MSTVALNPRGVEFSRFTMITPTIPPAIEAMTKFVSLPNPLNPAANPSLIQPEAIPTNFQNEKESYCIYIPPLLMAGLIANPQATARVTLLFCVGSEFNRHGLRSIFEPKQDRVLITISGRERQNPATPAWGVGITDEQIRSLFTLAGFRNVNFIVDTIAGYSTGYRGVNGTVNNSLIALNNIRRLIFYDALYWGDEPALPPGVQPLPNPPGVSPPSPGSPRNTWRMLASLKAINPALDIITYEVTDGGTPRDGGRLRVDVPNAKVINLKPHTKALTALILARVTNKGVSDGYLLPSQIPLPVRTLSANLPKRGTLASSPLTAAMAASGLISNWATANQTIIDDAVAQAGNVGQAGTVVELIRQNRLTGWEFPSIGDMCHDGFIPEFGWEFLTG